MSGTTEGRYVKMIGSAVTAGLSAGLIASLGGANVKASILAGLVLLAKDLHSYWSTSPKTEGE